MTVYLRKQLIADTPTTKKEVYNYCLKLKNEK